MLVGFAKKAAKKFAILTPSKTTHSASRHSLLRVLGIRYVCLHFADIFLLADCFMTKLTDSNHANFHLSEQFVYTWFHVHVHSDSVQLHVLRSCYSIWELTWLNSLPPKLPTPRHVQNYHFSVFSTESLSSFWRTDFMCFISLIPGIHFSQ